MMIPHEYQSFVWMKIPLDVELINHLTERIKSRGNSKAYNYTSPPVSSVTCCVINSRLTLLDQSKISISFKFPFCSSQSGVRINFPCKERELTPIAFCHPARSFSCLLFQRKKSISALNSLRLLFPFRLFFCNVNSRQAKKKRSLSKLDSYMHKDVL